MDYEKSGELPKALLCWEVVQAFQPTDEEVARKIADLKAQMLALAKQHFKKGISYYQESIRFRPHGESLPLPSITTLTIRKP